MPNNYSAQRRQRKQKVIDHYSKGTGCCARCGYKDLRALSVDHKASDGAARREEQGKGSNFYQWIVNNNYPEGFQILCMNCQWVKRHEKQEFSNQYSTR
jgi:hypothetical protein